MLDPKGITDKLNEKAPKFLYKSNRQLVLGGILAGIFVGLAAITTVTVTCDMKNYFGIGFTKLISGIVFSLGLILIVLSGSELFTGSNLNIVVLFKDKKYLSKLLKKWGIVYFSNFIGCMTLIFILIHTGIFNDELISQYFIEITKLKLELSFIQAFSRGVLCNFLVCLAVRAGEASHQVSGKILAYIYVIGAFVINGFEHSIANMFFIPVGIFLGRAEKIYFSLNKFIFGNLIPVTLGNIVGGALFVGVVYYIIHSEDISKKKIKAKN